MKKIPVHDVMHVFKAKVHEQVWLDWHLYPVNTFFQWNTVGEEIQLGTWEHVADNERLDEFFWKEINL